MNPGACLHGGYREHICSVSVPSVSGQTHPKGTGEGVWGREGGVVTFGILFHGNLLSAC
jgi:hypothetical protein